MELAGKVIAVLEPRGGVSKTGNEWKVQEYVIETHDQYPKKMCFDVFGADKIAQFNIQAGEELNVFFDVDAREWNGRRGSDHGAVGRLGGRGHLGFGDRRGFRALDLDFVIHAVDHDVRYRRGLVHVVDLDVVIMSVDFQRVIFHFLFWVVLFRRRVLSPVGKLG